MVVCQPRLLPFLVPPEEGRHQDRMAAAEEAGSERTDLADAGTSVTEEEVEVERDSMIEDQLEAYRPASGEEARRRQIESRAMAGEEEEVMVETGVGGEEEDGSDGVRVK